MNHTAKIASYFFRDALRSRWVLGYGLFVALTTDLLLRFDEAGPRVLLSMGNLALLLVPLVGILFGAIHLYNSRAFVEMLLAQPVARRHLHLGLHAGMALPLAAAFLDATRAPFLHPGRLGQVDPAILGMLLASGPALTLVFVGIATAIVAGVDEKTRGLGLALVTWLFLALAYDGLVLLAVQLWSDYPLEQPMIGLMMLNPIDLARVSLLMQFDTSALMGYTGAVFERFFGSALGLGVSLGALVVWIVGPFLVGRRVFCARDF